MTRIFLSQLLYYVFHYLQPLAMLLAADRSCSPTISERHYVGYPWDMTINLCKPQYSLFPSSKITFDDQATSPCLYSRDHLYQHCGIPSSLYFKLPNIFKLNRHVCFKGTNPHGSQFNYALCDKVISFAWLCTNRTCSWQNGCCYNRQLNRGSYMLVMGFKKASPCTGSLKIESSLI